ncbi:MAG: beta-ketoacyl synthase N-terminal-like domain-containing protein, partial [Clostridiaceae bacterium]|nr:beta-ketoacyl synthase N-terminal-like domain-containing protein [Clostridiaceae bacterium]
MTRRVVITGLGVISPVGCGVEKFWNSLKEGQNG